MLKTATRVQRLAAPGTEAGLVQSADNGRIGKILGQKIHHHQQNHVLRLVHLQPLAVGGNPEAVGDVFREGVTTAEPRWSGSSRRHSMETICHPAAERCWIMSGLKGPATTSRTRSKYAMESLRRHGYAEVRGNSAAISQGATRGFKDEQPHSLTCAAGTAIPGNFCPFLGIHVQF